MTPVRIRRGWGAAGLFVLLGLATGCASPSPSAASAQTAPEAQSSALRIVPPASPSAAPTDAAPLPSATPTLSPEDWQDLPIIPTVSQTAREIYLRGLALGNDPQAFSKVGDCQNVPSMFLAPFDDPRRYHLGDHADLQETIDYFQGSFSRESQAVRGGFNAASVLSPFWSDPEACESGEAPVACEMRLHRPSIVIISLETWWEGQPEAYERYYRQVVEYVISQGAVPILVTKADNLEGDWAINAVIARAAYDYDVPLWNFWRAVQPLPDHGLLEDGFHLTFDLNYFDEPQRMESAWPWRNLGALQALDAVRRGLAEGVSPSSPTSIP
jgi:hypothetical protein